MSISNKDNSLQSARSLGQLNGTKAFNDFVGKKDRIDFRRFRLTQRSSVSLTVSKLRTPVTIRLMNQVGATIARLRPTGKRGQISLTGVDAGTYYVSVARGRRDTRYRLALTATAAPLLPPGAPPNPNPPSTSIPGDNTAGTARNLGTLTTGSRSFQDYVGELDKADFYKFNVASVSDFNANLSGTLSGGFTSLTLYRDNNNNGQVDNGERVDYKFANSSTNISQVLTPGSYFLAVEKSSGAHQYDLVLTTTAYPDYTPAITAGSTPSTARNLGTLAGTFTTKDYVGNLDKQDFYKFTLNSTKPSWNFNANLATISSSGFTYLYLYRDNNNNGQIDSGERVTYNYTSGSSTNISRTLTPGNYFVSVEKSSGAARYDLLLQAI